ncbi:MAG: cytidylate kinase-like family protein [Bacteroidales bacterium]|nr:cytidylate kinase-like family protein [Bacteroidales bacterium]
MKNFLEEYLKEQHLKTSSSTVKPGPVVTLSREFGCDAKPLYKKLLQTLNTFHLAIGQKEKWNIISKEILDESAKELRTNSKNIEYLFAFDKKSSVDDFFMSMTSKYYQSDWKVREAVTKVVRAFALKGHAIIVGRAGAQIIGNNQQSLHVKIIASHQWRVKRVKEKYQISEIEANKKVEEMDENRKRLISMFSKDGDRNEYYDVFYNLEHLGTDLVISDIVHLMQLKKLIA